MMLDTKKIAIGLVLAVLAGGSWWLARQVTPTVAAPSGKMRHDPDYVIENFTADILNEHGHRKYTLRAERLVHFPDDDTSELKSPYLIQHGNGGVIIHTRANFGKLMNQTNQLEMTGHVRITRGRDARSAGGEIRTESIKILLDK